jgi:RHS repeat-associated protein
VKKVAGTVTEELYFDGADCVGELYSVTGESPITVNYVTPSLDENITMTRGSSDYYYTQDGLGSVRELLDASQTTQNSYDYEAFGSAYNWSENVVNRYTYTGREWDAESRSIYQRWRNNFPTLGRFGQRDLLLSSNPYIYVSDCPTIFTDPIGLWKIERKGEERATVIAENDQEVLSDLAKMILLDEKEATDWLQVREKELQWRAYRKRENIVKGNCYSVPNRAYLDVGSYSWGFLAYRLLGWVSILQGKWVSEGLKVEYFSPWMTTYKTVKEHLTNKDLYKFVFIGHGASGVIGGLEKSEGIKQVLVLV